MTLEQAEKEYKFCFGNEGYYMWHEIGEKAYREYCDLYIPRETKAKWDTEMTEKDLDALYESPSGASSWFDRIIDALARGYMDVNKYADKLLCWMEYAHDLSDENRIRIIKRMGEESQFHKSGCQVYFNTPYAKRMHGIMKKWMDFVCEDEPLDPRFPKSPSKLKLYREAVEAYKKAYEKYSGNVFDNDLTRGDING